MCFGVSCGVGCRLPAVRDKLLQLNAAEVAQMTDVGVAFDALLSEPLLAHAEAGDTSQVRNAACGTDGASGARELRGAAGLL